MVYTAMRADATRVELLVRWLVGRSCVTCPRRGTQTWATGKRLVIVGAYPV